MPHTINVAQMIETILTVGVKKRKSLLFIGSPGLGKTFGTMAAANAINALFHPCDLTSKQPVDLRGICDKVEVQSKVGKTTKVVRMTDWLFPVDMPFKGNPNFPDDQTIIMLVDELGSVGKNMFPPVMQLLLERRIGANEIKDNVVIVAATNFATDRGTSVPLPSTVYSRCAVYHVKPDMNVWADHFESTGGTPLARAYYSFKPEDFYTFDPKNREQTVFACPRTNSEAWGYWMDPDLPDWMKEASMAGSVGDGVAAQIIAFGKAWQKIIKVRDILKDPEGIAIPVEADIRWATAASVSGAMTAKNADTLAKYLKRHRGKYAEIEAMAWTLAARRTDGTPDDVCRSDAYVEWLKELGHVYL